jgi:hypothetical protein
MFVVPVRLIHGAATLRITPSMFQLARINITRSKSLSDPVSSVSFQTLTAGSSQVNNSETVRLRERKQNRKGTKQGTEKHRTSFGGVDLAELASVASALAV